MRLRFTRQAPATSPLCSHNRFYKWSIVWRILSLTINEYNRSVDIIHLLKKPMIRGLVDFKNVSGDQVEQYCKNCANLKHLQLFFCATDSLFLRIFNTFNYSELMCVFILFFFRKGVSCFQGNCNMFLILIFYFNKSNYNKLMCTCHKRKLINFLNVSIWSISPHKWVFVLMKSMGSSINCHGVYVHFYPLFATQNQH